MKISKIVAIAFTLAFAAISSVSALGVNEEEIRVTGDVGTIQFQNYTGPHTVIESANAITNIGRGLGRQVSGKVNTSASFGLNGKYSIIHAIDPNETGKFDADILILNPNAGVDHIKNLRRIIAGYLSSAYGYTEKDATTIATFVTVYNAVYRKNMAIFRSRYKDVVTRNLTAEKCGLSTVWSEWPGNTQIVIPLYDVNGGISTVDTGVISDRNVIDSMREDDDKNIDPRKEMVDIMEREADEANKKAQEARDKADKEKEKLEEQQQKQNQAESDAGKADEDAKRREEEARRKQQEAAAAEEEARRKQQEEEEARRKAEQAARDAAQAQQQADKNPDDKAAQEEAERKRREAEAAEEEARRKQQEAAAAEEEARRKQEAEDEAKRQAEQAARDAEEARRKAEEEARKTAEQQQKTDEADKTASEKEAFAERKEEEAAIARMEIAKDQQALLDDALDVPDRNGVIGLKVVNDAKELSQLIKINAKTSDVIRLSPVTVVHRRTIFAVTDPSLPDEKDAPVTVSGIYYMAVCGDSSITTNSAVKLCLLDSNFMEIQKESNEFVADDSVLVTDGEGSYYCIIKDGSNWVVGKYDKSVNLLVKGKDNLQPNTPITISSAGVIVTDAADKLIILDQKTLTKK